MDILLTSPNTLIINDCGKFLIRQRSNDQTTSQKEKSIVGHRPSD